jgi:hypothetical protein
VCPVIVNGCARAKVGVSMLMRMAAGLVSGV